MNLRKLIWGLAIGIGVVTVYRGSQSAIVRKKVKTSLANHLTNASAWLEDRQDRADKAHLHSQHPSPYGYG